ncbi:cytochrome P450 [Xylariomycetidae sp. FL2044]|nr:cytochrome P450 [Xylariomycetidae sp. FL2044]
MDNFDSRGVVPLSCMVLLTTVVYFVLYHYRGPRHGESPGRHIKFGNSIQLAPAFLQNLIFATKATSLLQNAYQKFRGVAFQLVRNDTNIVVLPHHLLEELASLPTTVASPQAALEHDLLGRYTGLDLILENRMHHTIVQRKLTPKLSLLVPRMEKAVSDAIHANFPPNCGDDWIEFQPYQVLGVVSARVAADVIVGPAFCESKTWLDISFNYTENLFRTIVILRLLPLWIQPLVCLFLPSYWAGQRYLRTAKDLLGPRISDLIKQSDAGLWEPADNDADDLNILSWLSSMARGQDRRPETISHILVLVALASVHTTLLRMVNVLYDIVAAGPELLQDLLREISAAEQGGWTFESYDQLHRLDSVLRESQRLSPPTTLGLKRLFRHHYTFRDGTFIPANTYVCLPIHAIENDARHTPNPQVFDGLRSFRARHQHQLGDELDSLASKEYLFSTPTQTSLNFGYGKSACPGRFFASCVVKMVIVKMITEYDFSFMPGTGRPSNLTVHEFLFTWPWQKMLMRAKTEGSPVF